MKIISTFFLFLFSLTCLAQIPTQNLRGTIKEGLTQTALPGALVTLQKEKSKLAFTTQSDEAGSFIFSEIEVGSYRATVELAGFQTQIVSEISVKGGKETVLTIELRENIYDLDEVTVKAGRSGLKHPVSVQTLTIEEVNRFPATYFDPARLAISLAGVVNTNDQSNGISVRGNSPNALVWRLEGAEIVNPNHTPNAGTFSDRITLSGGGVNMLSAQMLDNTNFLRGAFPTGYGNALGAVMDMNLREGNRKETELTAQIGLIGIDLAAEGPLGKNEKSAFMTNYRYSTVGLLGALGVDLGGEEISFQDFAVKADFLTKKGKFSVFGIGGTSKNIFTAQRDLSAWEVQKDRFDIKFNSTTGIGGFSYGQTIGDKSFWKTSLVYSATENTRTAERLDDNFNLELLESDSITYQKIAFHSVFSHKISAINQIKLGLNATLHDFSVNASDLVTRQFAQGSGQGILWQPYVSFDNQFTEKISFNFGLQASYFDYNNTSALEPRAALTYRADNKNKLSLAYGLHSQIQSPQLYTAQRVTGGDNQDLELSKVHHFIFAHKLDIKQGLSLTSEVYYQSFFDIPEPFPGGTTFSGLNLSENYTTEPLQSTGSGRNIGLEMTLQQIFQNNTYFLINGTLYDAKYTDVRGREHNAQYNGNYIINLTRGREKVKTKGNKVKTWGYNTRLGYAGGLRYTPIDLQASVQAGTTVYDLTRPFEEKYPAYFKIDIRIYRKISKPGRSSMLSLDIQNLTNRDNVAFEYFDPEVGQIITKNQLGLLPILTWRLEL